MKRMHPPVPSDAHNAAPLPKTATGAEPRHRSPSQSILAVLPCSRPLRLVAQALTFALLAATAEVAALERIEAITPEEGKSELASTAADPAGGYAQSRTRAFRSPALAQVGDPPRGGKATFEGLGDLEGGDFDSAATEVSTDGSVVVGFGASKNGTEAFRWEDGAMEGMGDLEGGSFQSIAIGVSADGSVVVGRSASETGIIAEAFRWADGTMEGLGFLGGGFLSSQAFAVSADGTVVVGGSTSDSGEAFRRENGAMEGSSNEAFRWEDGAMEGLGDLEGGQFGSIANDVSADGAVVVGQGFSEPCEVGSFCGEAFRWENGAMEGLGDLEGGDFFSAAFGVSADGAVVVGVSASDNSGTEAFRWEGGVMQGLGDLPGGTFASFANDVSADGSVIVGLGVSEEGVEAVIWTEEGGMRSLKEIIEGDFGLDLTGWTLSSAEAVSADGTVFVGMGFNPEGNPEAWRAFLPPGNGGTAELVFAPASLDFGDVEVSTTSASQTATLQNTGDVDVTGITFTVPGSGFDADTSECGDTLPAGGSCAVSVTFTPQVPGPAGATLHVGSNEGATADLDLSGNGVEGGEPPVIDVDPDSLSSTLPEGGTETQDLTISNLGGEPLEWEVTEDGATGIRVARSADRSSPTTVGAREGRTSRTVVRVTEEGVFLAPDVLGTRDATAALFAPEAAAGPAGVAHSLTQGATLWSVDDAVAIAAGVAIDDSTVWGAWQPNASRLTAHPISGDGTPAFEFPASDSLAGATGVASAKGADRILFLERERIAGDEQRVHSFTSQSNGTPDWTFEFEFPTVPGATTSFRQVAVSYDGSTAAATFRDFTKGQSTLYVFDAETGDVILTWTDPMFMRGVDLTDDGSLALVTQSDLATVLDTATGDILFQTAGSGGGDVFYRISGDGSVLVLGGFDLDVYQLDGTTYQPVIEFTQPDSWFGQASAVSRDGSTVGTFAGDLSTGLLEGEVFLFDVANGEMLGSHPISGGGAFQGLPVDADSNDDGSVMAFASWGTQNQDWPEVMVFDRDVELIGAIEFPGSAFSVDVTADGQFVAGGAKAVHANVPGAGGRIELIDIEGGVPGDCVLPSWVSVDPLSGSVPGGESRIAELTFDATGLDEGEYTANLCLASSDPVRELVTVPLSLTVENPAPKIDVSPDSLSSTLQQGQSETQPLTISNPGEEPLEWAVTEEGQTSGGLLRPTTQTTSLPTRRPSPSTRGLAPAPAAAAAAAAGHANALASYPFISTGTETTITHSESLDILGGNSIACIPDGSTTPASQFLRTFALTDFEIAGAFDVTEVAFGIEILTSTASIDVNLYTLQGDFEYANLTQIGTSAVELAPQALMLVTVPVTGEAPAGATLVVEIAAPDLSGVAAFFPGSNDLGETAPSYVAANACGAPEPTPYADIGFPDVHLVMTVTGTTEPLDCTLPEWVTVDPLGGTVPSGEDQVVEVTFDSTGMAPGDFDASLCLSSNDPTRPLTTVPLTLTVTEPIPGEGYEPMALTVDPVARVSDGNAIFEPGELVDVAPSWRNDGEAAQSLMGEASSFTGPTGADYELANDGADYGLIEPGATASCLDTGVCYRLGINGPAVRPATHWEATFVETLDDTDGTSKTWVLHIGASFTDVPPSNAFYPWIETLLHSGVTGGCADSEYCPAGTNSRAQMAVFVLKAAEDPGYEPPACVDGAEMFTDVPFDSAFCPWIEDLANRGIVAGCGGGNYCPGNPVSRAQMAIFLLKTLEGDSYTPPECTGEFTDVLCPSLFADWIEDLAAREITGGCTATTYCPGNPVSRAQMAVFVTKAFGFTLYGP